MSHERLLYLAHLVDRINTEVDAAASITYEKFSNHIHITIFAGKTNSIGSRTFDESTYSKSEYDMTYGDKDLVKAEAFMRMLLRSAQYYPPMRATT